VELSDVLNDEMITLVKEISLSDVHLEKIYEEADQTVVGRGNSLKKHGMKM
jgi:hypothetical protein